MIIRLICDVLLTNPGELFVKYRSKILRRYFGFKAPSRNIFRNSCVYLMIYDFSIPTSIYTDLYFP